MELTVPQGPLTLLPARFDFESNTVTEIRQRIQFLTGNRGIFDIDGGQRDVCFQGAHHRLGNTAVHLLQWDGDTRNMSVHTDRVGHLVAMHIPVQGKFQLHQHGRSTLVSPGQLSLVSAAGRSCRTWHGPSSLINFVFTLDSFESVLRGELGLTVDRHLEFDPCAVVDRTSAETLWKTIEIICHDLSSQRTFSVCRELGDHFERALRLMILLSFRHNYSDAVLARDVTTAPSYIRTAERHVAANFAGTITLASLADAARVSVRTLQYGFKAFRGVGPMRYVKNARLDAARDMILRNAEATSLAAIARAVGYKRVGHFCRDYRERFEDNPRGH